LRITGTHEVPHYRPHKQISYNSRSFVTSSMHLSDQIQHPRKISKCTLQLRGPGQVALMRGRRDHGQSTISQDRLIRPKQTLRWRTNLFLKPLGAYLTVATICINIDVRNIEHSSGLCPRFCVLVIFGGNVCTTFVMLPSQKPLGLRLRLF